MKVFGKIEIVLGLILVAFGIYAVGLDVLWGEDRHGYRSIVGQLGASFGGLVAFAGAVLTFAPRFRWAGHVPFLAFAAVFVAAYGDAFV